MFCIYPALNHYAVTHGQFGLALGALTGVLICAGLCLPGKAKWLLALPAPLLLLLYFVSAEDLLTVPPVLINFLVCVFFAHSLARGEEPVISRIARIERGELDAALTRYTRRLTLIWAVFFALMAITSALLALWAPLPVWSLFTNLVNYLLVGLLFFGEFVYRRWRYRAYPHASALRVIRHIWGQAAARRR
ncbi:MAG: hypothetical protein ACREUV_08795 [Burkholderiales bacterium]